MEGWVQRSETVGKLVGRTRTERKEEQGDSGGSGPCLTEMAKIQRRATKLTESME